VLLLHEPRRVLTPLAARYLYGRAWLICGGWSESVRELRAVLEQSRALSPLLAFLRVSETALLRQLALAMLCDGQAHALLFLLLPTQPQQPQQLSAHISAQLGPPQQSQRFTPTFMQWTRPRGH
jgi:hypothetical protein